MDNKVLLVDDDYDVRAYMKVMLESENFLTEQAEKIIPLIKDLLK